MPTKPTAFERVESVAIVPYGGFDELDAIGP